MPHPAGRTPEEAALPERAMRALPGGGPGGYHAPQDLACTGREGRGARLVDCSGRENFAAAPRAAAESTP